MDVVFERDGNNKITRFRGRPAPDAKELIYTLDGKEIMREEITDEVRAKMNPMMVYDADKNTVSYVVRIYDEFTGKYREELGKPVTSYAQIIHFFASAADSIKGQIDFFAPFVEAARKNPDELAELRKMNIPFAEDEGEQLAAVREACKKMNIPIAVISNAKELIKEFYEAGRNFTPATWRKLGIEPQNIEPQNNKEAIKGR